MLDEMAIAQINANLSLCDSYLLNESEINYLNAIGADPKNTCDYWGATQTVLDNRAKTDESINESLALLIELSNLDGCSITLEPEVIPDVDIPYFGGGL